MRHGFLLCGLSEAEELSLINNGQVSLLTPDGATEQLTEHLLSLSELADDHFQVLIHDNPDGLRVLDLKGGWNTESWLFPEKYSGIARLLIDQGLAIKALRPATGVIASQEMPGGPDLSDPDLLCTRMLIASVPGELCFGRRLARAGVVLNTKREAQLAQLFHRLTWRWAMQTEPAEILTANKSHRNVGRVF